MSHLAQKKDKGEDRFGDKTSTEFSLSYLELC